MGLTGCGDGFGSHAFGDYYSLRKQVLPHTALQRSRTGQSRSRIRNQESRISEEIKARRSHALKVVPRIGSLCTGDRRDSNPANQVAGQFYDLADSAGLRTSAYYYNPNSQNKTHPRSSSSQSLHPNCKPLFSPLYFPLYHSTWHRESLSSVVDVSHAPFSPQVSRPVANIAFSVRLECGAHRLPERRKCGCSG
jgi:hypothetical protein